MEQPTLFKTTQLKGNNWETENREGQSKSLCGVNMRVMYQNIWGHEGDKSFGDVRVFSSVLRRPAQLEKIKYMMIVLSLY